MQVGVWLHSHFVLAHCCWGISFCVIEMDYSCHWKSLVGKTDRLGRVFFFVFNYCIHIHIHIHCHIQSNTPIEATHLESKSPDIRLLMLWQLVHLFIVEEVMEADRSSWSSCLQGLLFSTWLILCPVVLIQRDGQLGVGLQHNKCIDLWTDLHLWSVLDMYSAPLIFRSHLQLICLHASFLFYLKSIIFMSLNKMFNVQDRIF